MATTISRDEVVLQEHGITPTADAVAAYRLGMRAVSVTAELELRQRELFAEGLQESLEEIGRIVSRSTRS